MSSTITAPAKHSAKSTAKAMFEILVAISFCHLLNDMVQALLPSMYPILKGGFHLSFAQIGLITLAYQITASLLQPLIGHFTDKTPRPYSLALGMTFTLLGLILLAFAPGFWWLVTAASLVGLGSAVFHPGASRVTRQASSGKHGFAQSFFQVGGYAGSAIGPLLAAFIVLPHGQRGILWFAIPALIGIAVLLRIGNWSRTHQAATAKKTIDNHHALGLTRTQVYRALSVLIALTFSKYFYLASFTSYYTFYLITRFHMSVRSSQEYLFLFLASIAAGTLIGGSVGDKIGRKYVIWISILGVLPFTLLLPHVDLFWTGVLSFVIGFVISSAFSAIVVYAQELMPNRIGMISGVFFGLAFGMGGIGAAIFGKLADTKGILYVYQLCAYLPAIGLLTGLLPNLDRKQR